MASITKPNVLKEGSTIGIVAASSSFSREKFYRGVDVLKSLGFKVSFSENIFRKSSYLAGSDHERAGDLNQILADPDIDAIMFARGGYGVQRIIPFLDFSAFKECPKPVVGFSDLTALTSYITSHLNIPCFYGPVVTVLAEGNEATARSLKKALTSISPLTFEISPRDTIIKEGEARGRFLGGCLSLIASSIGTKYELAANGSILFIEDAGERIYKYDRMLTHLKNSGRLNGVAGIVFGPMGLDSSEAHPEGLWSTVKDILHDFEGPVVAGLSAGHTAPFLTLPLGVECRLVAKGGKNQGAGLIFEEAALI